MLDENLVPGGNAIGMVEAVGKDVWHLKEGQRIVTSSHLVASENVQEPGQILIGVTSPGGVGDALQHSWKDGTLAEYVLLPAEIVTPIEGLDDYSLPQIAAIEHSNALPIHRIRVSGLTIVTASRHANNLESNTRVNRVATFAR